LNLRSSPNCQVEKRSEVVAPKIVKALLSFFVHTNDLRPKHWTAVSTIVTATTVAETRMICLLEDPLPNLLGHPLFKSPI
jgi:hypothetical protein